MTTRSALLAALVLIAVSGCAPHATYSAHTLDALLDPLLDPMFDGLARQLGMTSEMDGPRCGRETVCVSAETARRMEGERIAQSRTLMSVGRELTRTARDAALVGDCETVLMIQRRVLVLPSDGLEGGIHDNVFLREPAIVRCLVEMARP